MKNFILLICLLATSAVFAQQDPVYSQYMLNPQLLNPAYAGLNNNFNILAGYRTQWTNFEGQPQTLNLAGNISLVDNKVGTGLLLVQDRIGNITNTEINASFAYKLDLDRDKTFSFGMQAGFQNFRTDYSQLNVLHPDDHAFAPGERGTRMNIGAGAILKSEGYFIGLSVPRLLPTTFKNGGQEFELYNRHVYLMAGYVYFVNDRIRLKPSALLRAVKGAPASVDLAFNVNFNAVHTAGLFTRNLNTYGLLLQTLLKDKYRFGYVFELPTNKSVGMNFTTHEITLGLMLPVLGFHDRSLSNSKFN
ncbi:MAG: type IX secretion system membrane protein PorP/SprF [Cyclobacteriaceae bacterium]|nr:type IX secretion system membrane protein PorP/SprF [Cyclobacteriaceae bacterium]